MLNPIRIAGDKKTFDPLNPDYALGIVMRAETARKSGSLEIEASHRYGEIENSSVAADFKAV